MNVINTNPALDFKTMTAVLSLGGEESLAILGAWKGMETLAQEDPDGCVRMSPDLPMDNMALAAFFHCTETIVAKTVDVFKTLGRLTVKDGLIKIAGCAGDNGAAPREASVGNGVVVKPALSEEALARKREQARIRKAKSRARQKQAKMTGLGENVEPFTSCDNHDKNDIHDKYDKKCDKRDSECDQRDTACDTSRAATALYYRDNNIYNLHPSHAYKPVSKYVDLNHLIPLHELPEEYRNVIGEWNKLPLPKYKGLVPELLEKLKYLVQRYGETTLCKTIAGIAGNTFLLGKKEGRTWTVSLGWLLEPENFAKVLSGKYQDRQSGDSHCLNWRTGERLPFYLPGEGEEGFTPEEQKQALRDLFVPTTPAQLKAARLVGLPGYKEATA